MYTLEFVFKGKITRVATKPHTCRQDIRAMTVRHIKYGAKAEDVATFSTAFIDSVERILAEKW